MLARQGLGSRRQIESWIAAGRLEINGEPAALGSRITLDDQVRLDGRPLRLRENHEPVSLFLCHRSPGDPLRAGADAAERTALLDRLPRRAGRRYLLISPMPRIDGGLEIVTADGALASRLQRAVRGIESEFIARIRGDLNPTQRAAILRGERDAGPPLVITECEAVESDESPDEPAAHGGNRWYRIVARGVSGSDLRQVLERCGAVVSRILRTRLGALALPRDLPRGGHRSVTAEEAERALLASELRVETAAGDAARRRR